jgi:hypothetical protein
VTTGNRRDNPDTGMGLTRWRDITAVTVIAGLLGYLLLRWNYQRLPALPLLAGLPAAVIGVGEAIVGVGLRNRIRSTRGDRAPIDPLSAARAVAMAKATALAAAALSGLWLGALIYLLPQADRVTAAAGDRTSAVIGLLSAAVMLAGGLFLERCCRTPDDPDEQPSGPGY